MEKAQPLKIYKAAAGSGKTYTLAAEYIRLLVEDPSCYSRILAVTFTNKATTEMKERILGQLYGIAHGLKDSDDYLETIQKALNKPYVEQNLPPAWNEETIRQNAKTALASMMHDYGRFRIETIDSFFQSIVRELAHELDLTANLRVEINTDEALENAVEAIIDETVQKPDLMHLLLEFVMERIENDRAWQVAKDMKSFGFNIFNEEFLRRNVEVRQALSDVERLKQLKAKLYGLIEQHRNARISIGLDFLRKTEALGLSATDFSRGNDIFGFFTTISKGTSPCISKTMYERSENADVWVKKGVTKHLGIIATELIPILQNAIKELTEGIREVNTAEVALQHLDDLMLVGYIDRKVREMNADANRFLLADTAHFLHEMMDGSDVPFIYEKAGVRFTHIMIDEFQDTSRLQWENFRPLIKNAIDSGGDALVVGDVKQSIYRWRGSDWRTLNDMGKNKDFGHMSEIIPLDTNYRSDERVVEFNNAFFEAGTEYLSNTFQVKTGDAAGDLKHAYSGLRQKVKNSNKGQGFVSINCIREVPEGTTLQDLELEQLTECLRDLFDNGVKESDIGILVRAKESISLIVKHLSEQMPDMAIVTEEGFLLSSSMAVETIVMALRMVRTPDDRYVKGMLAYYYQNTTKTGKSIDEVMGCNDEQLMALLPKAFTDALQQMSTLPLYTLCERLCHIFKMDEMKGQEAYLFYFFDKVSEYLSNHSSDLGEFIAYWDETLNAKPIPNTTTDGIRIMTIHKSKGLQFHTVLFPFCEWEFDGRASNLLWCEPQDAPCNQLPLLPVNYTKKTCESGFHQDYTEELLRNYVDNLNLAYVALTRAEHNLCIITGCKQKASINANTLICQSIQAMKGSTEDLYTYVSGEIVPSKNVSDEQKEQTENRLLQAPEPVESAFIYRDSQLDFRQSNKSLRFIRGNEETATTAYMTRGNLFHYLLSLINAADDVEKALRQMDSEGLFESDLQRKDILFLARKSLSQSETARWFDPSWTVINEATILAHDEQGKSYEKRPDRVITNGSETIVIDYKTGRHNDDYAEQVQNYMHLLQQMGYANVSGYLWYVEDGFVQPIK